MDTIWYRNHSKSEVIGRCGGDEKTEWLRRTDKRRTLKKIQIENLKRGNGRRKANNHFTLECGD